MKLYLCILLLHETFKSKDIIPYILHQPRIMTHDKYRLTIILEDYIVMASTRQHPFYLVEIHDATLAHNMREVFKKLWSYTEKE